MYNVGAAASGTQAIGTTWDAQAGISAAGFVVVQASSDLTVSSAVSATGAVGTGFVVIEISTDSDLLTISNTVDSTNDEIHLISDYMNIAAVVTVPAGQSIYVGPEGVSAAADPNEDIYIGPGGDVGNILGLSQAELENLDINGGGITGAVVVGRTTCRV